METKTNTPDAQSGKPSILTLTTIVLKSGKLVKVFKTAKIIKPLITFGTMIGSVLVYSLSLGLPMAVGLVLMLFIHELGHVVALKQKGLHASAPVFIPMLGAVIFAPDMGDRDDEAYMGIAGPIVGGIAASLLLLPVVLIEGEPEVLSVLAFVALLINLFNLIPLRPLDGGRVTQAVGSQFKYVGIALLILLSLFLVTPGILLIWILILGDIRLGTYRVKVSAGLLAVMLIMITFNIGTPQPFWIDMMDIVLATIYTMTYAIASEDDLSSHDARPELPRQQKMLWLGRYAILAVFLIAMMAISIAYLPVEVR